MISLNFGRNPFKKISLKKKGNKLRTYKDLKKKFGMENFSKLDIDRSDISNFVRLNRLENRLCPLCKFEVRDELHFIIKCTKLQELRNKFYQKISDILPSFYNLSDTEKFHLIFRDISYFIIYLKLCYLELRQHPLTPLSKTAPTHTPQ